MVRFPTIQHAVEALLHGGAGFDLPAVVDVLAQLIEDEAPESARQAMIEKLEKVYAEHTEEV
jgi:hypothetical protein